MTRNKPQARSVYHDLVNYTNRSIYLKKTIDWGEPYPVLVTTLNGFPGCNPDDWDIVIFTEGGLAAGKEGFALTKRLKDQRRYCFHIAESRLHFQAELRLEAACGQEVFRSSAAGGNLAKVRAKFAQPPAALGAGRRPSRRTGSKGTLSRKRITIWHNDQRNDHIANIAQAIDDRDPDRVRECGIGLNDDEADLIASRRLCVAVLVESPEHAKVIEERLSDWLLCVLVQDERGYYVTRSSPNGLIVTEAYEATIGMSCDVLLRATGGPHSLVTKGFPRSIRERHLPISFLIDINDQFDKQSARETQSRLEDYWERGWLTKSYRQPIHEPS